MPVKCLAYRHFLWQLLNCCRDRRIGHLVLNDKNNEHQQMNCSAGCQQRNDGAYTAAAHAGYYAGEK